MGELKTKAVKGTYWNAAQTLGNKVLSFFFLLLMTRLLLPSDYGMVGMLTVFMLVADAFISCGFGQAIVRKQNRTPLDESTVYYFSIAASIVCYIIIFLIAPRVGDFYNMPELIPILRVMGLKLIIGSLSSMQLLVYSIELDFKTPSLINITSHLLSGLVGVYLAYTGYGVWALVWQQLTLTIFTSLFFIVVSKWKPIWGFSWGSFKEMFSFGSKLLGTRLLNVVYANLSIVFIGKAYSAVDLGLYSKGREMASYPSDTLSGIINNVSYPLLCKLQDDKEKLTLVYRKLIRVVSFLLSPIMILAGVMGELMMTTLFGDKWTDSGFYLSLSCYPYAIVPVQFMNLTLLQVVGRTDLVFRLEVIGKILGVVMLIITLPISIEAMCYGVMITTSLCFFINTHYTSKFIDLTVTQQLVDLFRPMLYSALMGVIVYAITFSFSKGFIPLIMGTFVGLGLYIGLAALFRIQEFQDCLDIIKKK